MRTKLIVLLLVFSSAAYSQYIPEANIDPILLAMSELREVSQKTEDASNADKAILSKQYIDQIKEHGDYLYYKNLWDLSIKEESKEKRILLFKEILSNPFYNISDKNLNKFSKILYVESLKALIKEYRGALSELRTISVYPAFHASVYPFLKREIIGAGGTWDRGEIPELIINPPVKVLNNEK